MGHSGPRSYESNYAGSLRLLIVAGIALLVGIYNYYLMKTVSNRLVKEKMNDQSSKTVIRVNLYCDWLSISSIRPIVVQRQT